MSPAELLAHFFRPEGAQLRAQRTVGKCCDSASQILVIILLENQSIPDDTFAFLHRVTKNDWQAARCSV
jgi:hypothetical protein